MKAVQLLVLLIIMGACNPPKLPSPDTNAQYDEYLRFDSFARAHPDSAYYYYYTASENLTDSISVGMALLQMALMEQSSQNYNASNESAVRSNSFFNENYKTEHIHLSYNYNLLGSNCLELQRYDDAFRYYDLAIRYADSANIPVYKINKGVAYEKTKAYDLAISIYEDVLKENFNDTVVYTRVCSNLAKARWLKDPGYPALKEFHEARRLRELNQDSLGLNASYSHLADYYMKTNPDSARKYAESMYEIATKLDRPEDQVEALEKLIRLNTKERMDYFGRYDFLNDSIQLARSSAKNQFADVRFASEKVRANNLLLEKDNSQKKIRIIRQRIIIYGSLIIFATVVLLGIIWYRKRKRIQEENTRNAIRESALKTSQKVHDVVANGLYRIMNELEHGKTIELDPLLDKIEVLYEKSRDISYDEHLLPAESSVYSKEVQELLMAFDNEQTHVVITGNEQTFWNRVTIHERNELQLILTEIMVNMKKHSQAKNVYIGFSLDQHKAFISYRDDGRGFTSGQQFGNGLNNTVTRIKSLNGDVTFGESGESGVRMSISWPLQSTTT